MRKFLLLFLLGISCTTETPTEFSKQALDDTFISLDNQTISFKSILKKYHGKKVLIDVWASWCSDCIKGLPALKKLQNSNPDIVYIFLSLDKDLEKWKRGIAKYQLKGEHYFMQSGWKGDFGNFIDLDWIPRYMVINENGFVDLFKATKVTYPKIIEALKK